MQRFHLAWLSALVIFVLLAAALPARSQSAGSRYEIVQPPAELTLPTGTWITVRVDQTLSSDNSLPGAVFTTTLVQPLVVDGFVVARRGQVVAGEVAYAQRAGRAKGTSSLGLELTEISLVDGHQVPVLTEWIEYEGPTGVENDVATIATVTGLGAAIGAAVDGGSGAGYGALAGAAASTIGILSTRGKAVEIYPESLLTFRTLAPVAFSTLHSSHAFLPVRQDDYAQRARPNRVRSRRTYTAPPAYYFEYRYRSPRPIYWPRIYWYSYPRPHYIYSPRIVVAPKFVIPRVVRPHPRSRTVVIRPGPPHHRGGDSGRRRRGR